MLILGIDTATKTASTAIANFDAEDKEQDKILSEMQSCGRISHSENLMPMVDYTLKCAGVDLCDIDLFAVSQGPGSFTGIRIAIATVKGLAFNLDEENINNCNCAGISSLYSLAYNFYGVNNFDNLLILPVIDARRKQVYNSVFDTKLNCIKEDRIITVNELETELNSQFEGYTAVFIGDGADMCYSEINFNGKMQVSEMLKKPSAALLCKIAYEQYKTGKTVHARILAPSYLIKTQAEREYYEQNTKHNK